MSDVVLVSCVMAFKLIMRQYADGTGRGDSAVAMAPVAGDFIV